MKGGLTSGVVYPALLSELRQKYRFRSIGGSSAGAIAAALTAAAELGRITERGGFENLATVTDELKRKDFLLDFFQPNQESKPLMELGLKLLRRKKRRMGPGTDILTTCGVLLSLSRLIQQMLLGSWLGCVIGALASRTRGAEWDIALSLPVCCVGVAQAHPRVTNISIPGPIGVLTGDLRVGRWWQLWCGPCQ